MIEPLFPKKKSARSRTRLAAIRAQPTQVLENAKTSYKHLLQIKYQGYDDQHPANDPLWGS